MSFSIIIPLYNKALHIERAINSILNQKLKDFEIIIVNDGSTDNGEAIVKNKFGNDVNLITQKNQGVSAARNRGIEEAKNEYIAFLDADDEWLPDYLITIKFMIEKFPNCGAYATAIKTIRPNNTFHYPNLDKLQPQPWVGILPNFFELFQDGLVFYPSSVVIPKKIIKTVGGFPIGVKLSEDMVCWTKIAILFPIAFTTERMVIYHQEATNRSNIHKNLAEEPYVKIIFNAIEKDVIPNHLKKEAYELIAQKQIVKATENIFVGNQKLARRLLLSCNKTVKYKKKWIWWWFWSFFPSQMIRILLNIKSKSIRQ